MTKIERALTALYSGRCNLITACEIAEVDRDTMKRLLLDKVRCSHSHPIQLTLPLSYSPAVMSKKKAHFYTLEPLPATKQNLATMHFFDRKERRMMSSVDVVLNLDYLDDDLILGYVISR